jgi:hypothetical protein
MIFFMMVLGERAADADIFQDMEIIPFVFCAVALVADDDLAA